jgi:TatD DNase family protein
MSRREEFPPVPPELGAPLVDTHTHLDITAASGPLGVPDLLDRAGAAGVERFIQVGVDVPSSRWAAQLAAEQSRVWAAVALHPNEAPVLAGRGELDVALTEIDALAALPQVRAVGETGLDYFRTGDSGRPVQQESFRAHIDMAKRHGKALVIHDRDAHDDVVAVLLDEGPPQRVVFHCFSGDAAMAATCAAHGWFVSFAGVVTFKNAADLRQALLATPREQLLVETDAPFLTPVPYRGRPNASYLIGHTVQHMAATLGVDPLALAESLWANSERAFGPW